MNSNTTRISKSTLVALFFTCLLFATPVIAGEDKTHAFDANGDGKITFEEVMKKLEKSARTTFDTMDHNKDGVLSEKDFDGARDSMRKIENWLYDLIKPLMENDKSDSKAV